MQGGGCRFEPDRLQFKASIFEATTPISGNWKIGKKDGVGCLSSSRSCDTIDDPERKAGQKRSVFSGPKNFLKSFLRSLDELETAPYDCPLATICQFLISRLQAVI